MLWVVTFGMGLRRYAVLSSSRPRPFPFTTFRAQYIDDQLLAAGFSYACTSCFLFSR